MSDKGKKSAGKDFCICLGIMLAAQSTVLIPLAFLFRDSPFITPFTAVGAPAALLAADAFIIGLAATSARSQSDQEGGDGKC